MAVKLPRLGKDPSAHLKFLMRTNTAFMDSLSPHISHQHQIVDNQVLFRSPYCLLMPQKCLHASAVKEFVELRRGNIKICGPLEPSITWNFNPVFNCLYCHIATQVPLCRSCKQLRHCGGGAEVRFHLRDYTTIGKGVVLMVTV